MFEELDLDLDPIGIQIKSWVLIWIRIQMQWIRIRIQLIRIRNTANQYRIYLHFICIQHTGFWDFGKTGKCR
jgi:hypothetical protein